MAERARINRYPTQHVAARRIAYTRSLSTIAIVGLLCATLAAQQHGVVVNQTGLPLPGARVDLKRGDQTLATVFTGLDGAFDLPDARPADFIDVSLDGFETAHIEGANAQRIVLALA